MDRYDETQQLLFASYVHSSLPPTVQGDQRPKARRRKRRGGRCCGGGGGDAAGEAELKKRRLSEEQVGMLEMSFRKERKLETGRKVHLAAELGMDPKQVAVWFQNRRARHKSKLLEEEFAKLKSTHDAAILHKCHLENEVLKLKERLLAAEEEVRMLRSAGSHAVFGVGGDAGRGVYGAGASPSSSLSTDACGQRPGDGGDHLGDDDLMCVPEYDYNSNMMELLCLYGLV